MSKQNKITFLLLSIISLALLGMFIIQNNHILSIVYSEEGLVTAFFSFRDKLAIDAFEEVFLNWEWWNYIIGGIGHISRLPEVGVLDLIISFGILGLLIYILIAFKLIKVYYQKELGWLLIPIVLSIIIRGNFLYYPSVFFISIVIFVTTCKIYKNPKYV